MATAKGRVGGTWVDTNLTGFARVNNAWVEFGEAPTGPALESLVYSPSTPALTDASDGNDTYTLGIRFHVLVAKPCYGVRWRIPDNTPLPRDVPHKISLWDYDTQALIVQKDFVTTPGQYQDVLFDTPINLSAYPFQYVASVYSWHYVYRAPSPSSGWLLESPSGNVRGDEAKLSVGLHTYYPGSNFNAWYYVSPLVEV